MATKTTYTKNADGTITSRFDETPDAPNPTTQAPIQPAQPQQTVSPNGTTYTRNADGTITSRFADTSTPQQPTQPAQPQQPAQPITDWKNLNDAQKTNENLAKLVENRYNTRAEQLPDGVSANVGDTRYSWYLDEGKNPIRTEGTKLKQGEVQPNMAPTGLVFDKTSDWSALEPNQKTINNLQKLIEARYGTLAEVEGDRVVADIGGKMYQWTLDQNGNPVKTEVPADNTQFNSGEILEQLKANPSLDLSSYDPVEASIAKSNYDKIQNFSDMTNQQLSESFNSGDLIPGTAVRNDLVKNNPNMKSFLEMCSILNLINGVTINPLMMEKKVEENATKNKGMIATALEDGEFSQKEIDEITMSDDLKQQKKELDEQGKKVARLQSEYHTLELDIEDELKGQNATASYRDRLLAREGKNLYRELDLAQRTYQTMLGAYNDKLDRSMALFNLNLQLYKEAEQRSIEEQRLQEQRQWDIANQNRQMLMNYWNTLDERQYSEQQRQMQRQEAREDAIWQMETQMKYDMGDLKSDNPYLVQQAIRRISQGIYDAYSSLIPGLESPEMMEQRINQYIADGMTPTEAVQTVHDEKKNSNRMQSTLQNYQNQLNYDNWQMKTAMTPTISYGNYGVTGTGMASNVISSFISQCRETGSCGQGVNDYLEQLGEGRIFGSSYEDKYKNVNSDTPVEGAIAVRNPGKHSYGHVGIVTGVDGENVTIHDWNFNNDNKQGTRTVPISTILADGNGGFYIPQALQNNGGQQANYNPNYRKEYEAYLNGKLTEGQRDDLTKEYGGNFNIFRSEALAYEDDVINRQAESEKARIAKLVLDVERTAKALDDNKVMGRGFADATGSVSKYFDKEIANFRANYNALMSNLSLDNLINLKGQGATFGALSNQELNYIKSASTKLDPTLSKDEFYGELQNIYDILTGKMSVERKKQLGIYDEEWERNYGSGRVGYTTPNYNVSTTNDVTNNGGWKTNDDASFTGL